MKEATILLKLTKDHEVHKTNVTPVEAMLLVSEHHKAAGGCPIEVDKSTIKDIVVSESKDAKGNVVKVSRTVDEELDRLRGKYNSKKVGALSAQVRDIPTDDFDKALAMGVKIAMPDNKFASETKI